MTLCIGDDYYNGFSVYHTVCTYMNTVLYVYHGPGLKFNSFIWREANLKGATALTEHTQFTAFTSPV